MIGGEEEEEEEEEGGVGCQGVEEADASMETSECECLDCEPAFHLHVVLTVLDTSLTLLVATLVHLRCVE